MWQVFLLAAVGRASDGCPPRCNCMKYLGKFGFNSFFTECKSCRGPFKDKFWGDTCETPCAEYLDDNNPSEATRVGRGNCDGCDFEGECRECKTGFWDNSNNCKSDCPDNCRDPATDEHVCSKSGSCYGCKAGTCNLANGCSAPCPVNCLDVDSCSVASCTCTACKMGFWGSQCTEGCNEKGCLHCDKQSGRCLACKDEYYNLAEGCKKCSLNCAGERCNDDGSCANGCADKQFHGLFCEHKCPDNCEGGRCEQDDGRCVCKDGMHGRDCSKSCPDGGDTDGGCEDDRCEQGTGKCDCRQGWWGQICPEGGTCHGECDQQCSPNCQNNRCSKADGTCACKPGWWGSSCEQACNIRCLTGSCDQEKGTCEGCEAGFWGPRCEFKCDTHCRDGKCAQKDGTCKCEQGRWGHRDEAGEQCTKECEHCKHDIPLSNKWTERSRCKKSTGDCVECNIGDWGKFCDRKCATKCINGDCDRDDGSCTCQKGFWGDACQPCPSDCSDFCDGATGECIGGCQPGKWGKKSSPTANDACKSDCPDHCLEGVCAEEDGSCSACVQGWWGKNCDQPCPPNTADRFGCHQVDGHSHKCKPGWFGDKCDSNCPTHCAGNHCHQHPPKESPSGHCYECEGQKYQGLDCAQLCPENCADGKCTQEGQCFGCQVGWFGDKCDQHCPVNCNGRCNKQTGVCEDCIKGFWGDKCEGVCDSRCGTCKGPDHSHCTACDDAAQLCLPGGTSWFGSKCEAPPVNAMGKCKCLEGSTRFEPSSNKPQIILGHVIKKPSKCYCDVQGGANGLQWIYSDFGSGLYKCYPSCPRFMSQSMGRCYPNEVHVVLDKGSAGAGSCPDLERKPQYEIKFDPPLCLEIESAQLVYNYDPSVQPAPADPRKPLPKELCADDGSGVAKAKITQLCLPEKYKTFMIEKAAAAGGTAPNKAVLTV
jgi:hypothetical protein